jgi:multimeric flavodoxin WrbA
MQSRVIAVLASARRNGNTGRLLDRVADELNIEIVDLSEKNISAYDYQHRNRDDEFEPLMKRVLEFDRIIFASPVYWYAVSGPMKIFLDRISDYLDLAELKEQGRRLRGKTGHVLCTSIGKEIDPAYLGAYEKTFRYLGMRMGASLHANCRDGYRQDAYESDLQVFIRELRLAT